MNATDFLNWIRNVNEQDKIEEALSKLFPKVNLVYTKRWVIDPNKTKMPMDVRDFVRPSKTLISPLKPITLQDIFRERITYITDNFAYNGVLDVWQFSEETQILKRGDCDDSGAYRLAKAKSNNLGLDMFACLGYYDTTGHFFDCKISAGTLSRDFDSSVTILENTSNQYAPLPYKNSQYQIYYIFNENFAWKVKSGINFGKQIKQLQKEFGVKVNG